ncbi:class I SAM-dependent methyltransferase [Streptomyces sp. NPDC001107]
MERSDGFVAAARAHGSPPGLFARADAQAFPVGGAAVDVAVSGLVLNFLPEPGAAVAEAARVVVPGGWSPRMRGTTPKSWGCCGTSGTP